MRRREFGGSRDCLEVGTHDALLTQQPRELQDLLVGHSLARSRKTQRLDGDVESDLVPVLEAIDERAGDAVDTDDHTVD